VHQFRDGLCLHPLHDAAAMELHRLLDNAKIGRDLLVQLARRQRREHFALARSEGGQSLPELRVGRSRQSGRGVLRDCCSYRGHERRCRDRLRQKIRGAGLDRQHRHRNVAVPSDEDDRQWLPRRRQAALQFDSVDARHRDVQHEASFRPAAAAREECLGRIERLDVEALFAQDSRQRPRNAGSSSTRKTVCMTMFNSMRVPSPAS
jgi:hypothetical protein